MPTSSRYTICKPTKRFGSVAFGWDAVNDFFYVQWFKKTEEDDARPVEWLPRLTSVDQVQQSFAKFGAALPDFARRVLLAEQHDAAVDFAVGDRVHRGGARGTITELSNGVAHVTFDSGVIDSHHVDELAPDLASVGVL